MKAVAPDVFLKLMVNPVALIADVDISNVPIRVAPDLTCATTLGTSVKAWLNVTCLDTVALAEKSNKTDPLSMRLVKFVKLLFN